MPGAARRLIMEAGGKKEIAMMVSVVRVSRLLNYSCRRRCFVRHGG